MLLQYNDDYDPYFIATEMILSYTEDYWKKNRQKIISLIVCGKFKLIAFCVCFEKEINSVKFKKLESLLLVYVDKLYLCFVDAEDLFRGKKRTFFHNYMAYMEYKR